jgi:hypothetical protein
LDGKIFVLLIIGMVLAFKYLGRRQRTLYKQGREEREKGDSVLRADFERLSKRVEVLERIATDKGVRLKDEIDAL